MQSHETTETAATTATTATTVYRSQEEMSMPYATIKIFSEFGRLAGKPLAPSAVDELTAFWGRIQRAVSAKELSIPVVQRCVAGAAREARSLAGGETRIGGEHVREAVNLVRARAVGVAGPICRPPG